MTLARYQDAGGVMFDYLPIPPPRKLADDGTTLLGRYEVVFPSARTAILDNWGYAGTANETPDFSDPTLRDTLKEAAIKQLAEGPDGNEVRLVHTIPPDPSYVLQPLTEAELHTLLAALESPTVHGPSSYNDGECRACLLIKRIELALGIDRLATLNR